MRSFLQDVRFGSRMLWKSPGFTALTVACIALGIGVNSTMYSLVDTMIVRPLPFRAPDELVTLTTMKPSAGIDRSDVSALDLRDWQERTRAFSAIAALDGRRFTLSDRDDPERVIGAVVTSNLLPMLGVEPILGRQFREDEDHPGSAPVAILSHGLWERRYAGDPSIVGRPIPIDGRAHVVVGVMPPKFRFPDIDELWVLKGPLDSGTPNRGTRNLNVYARLRPGTTVNAAREDLQSVARALAAEYPEDKDWSANAIGLHDDFIDNELRLIIFTLMGSVTLVLLIACANVANLLLARATMRQREMAVRAALGAGRARIVRQLLTESVLVAVISVPLGVALAYAGLEWLTSAVPPAAGLPFYIDWSMNTRIVIYTVTISMLTGIVFGCAPALFVLRTDVHDALKEGGRSAAGLGRHHLRHALVVLEIAMALVLLVGASLFVRSFLNLREARRSLDTSRLMTMRFFTSGESYKDPAAMVRRAEDMIRRIEALPGVDAAVASGMVPLGGGVSGSGVVPEGMTFETGKEPGVQYFASTPHLLRTLGVSVVTGRDFTDADEQPSSTSAIVNQLAARRLWPNVANAVDQRFRLSADKQSRWLTVIGVVADFRLFAFPDTPQPYVFVTYPHRPEPDIGITVRVASGPPAAVMSAIRAEFRKADPSLPLFNVRTGDEQQELSYWGDRLLGWMFSIFAAIALVLASIGVYGVLSYAVSQRRQEIGVRVALGASRRNVFVMVMALAAKLVGIGIALGVLGALGVTRVVKSLLYNVSTSDPLSFVATAVFLAVVALIASYVPARRATAVDPIVALRTE